MKREIKFRAWHELNKQMLYPYARLFNDIRTSGDLINMFGDEFVMQFTGAYDKDGDEIYEGDILEFDAGEWGDNTTNKHMVSWDEYQHGWSFGGGGQQSDMEWRKIIGNIFENPELL